MAKKKPDQNSSKPVKPAPPSPGSEAEREAAREAERRQFVETMAGYGMPLEELGLLLVPPMSKDALEARYARQIEMGRAKGKAKIVGWMWSSAEDGNVTARKYLHQILVAAGTAPEVPAQPASQEPGQTQSPSSSLMPDGDAVRRILSFPARS